MKKLGSVYVLLVPLLVMAVLVTAVVAMRLVAVKGPTSSQSIGSAVVPTLRGQAGKPQKGFSATNTGTADLSSDFNTTTDDGGAADFQVLQKEAAKL